MFVSPCTLRSTQCAALIALAAVAGIARVEKPQGTSPAEDQASPSKQSRAESSPHDRRVGYHAPQAMSPWLHPVATVALWFLSGEDLRAASDLRTAPKSHAMSDLDLAFPSPTVLPAHSVRRAPAWPLSPPHAAFSARDHLIPFAVGPPSRGPHSSLRAVGTAVPGDDTVRSSSVSSFSFFAFRPVARLACPEFSGPILVGLSFAPSSALRGEPVRLSAPAQLRPPFGAPVCASRGLAFA